MRATFGVVLLCVAGLGGAAYVWLGSQKGPDLTEASTRATAQWYAASGISTEDLPPAGTRSLFDQLIAQNEGLPYPFDKLLVLMQQQAPSGTSPLVLMIPQGRSLLKAQADFHRPRLLYAADFEGGDSTASLGLAPRGQLFLGFVESAAEIEVISYNEAAGRFEFQLVQDYREGGVPRIVYARRAICITCHQAGAPIFPQRPWSETNGQPEIAQAIRTARGNDLPYLQAPLSVPLSTPERFDELAEVGNFLITTQRVWWAVCGEGDVGIACRRLMLKLALRYLWSPGDFDARHADAVALQNIQAQRWPAQGVAIAEKSLRNREPLVELRGPRGWWRSLWHSAAAETGAKTNDDLDAFERLPKLPANLDPLTSRAPKRVLAATDLDGVFGVASMFTQADRERLERASKHDLRTLMAAVDRLPASTLAPAPFVRVSTMQALLKSLGDATPAYCCLDTAELSPPVALGIPPLDITAGSVLEHYEQYCFACHRGNPAKRLNFMAGATEADVLANIQATGSIRDALDWDRYRNTDKANTLMPPADAHQYRLLEADLKQHPERLKQMREAVPALFDF